MDLEYHVVDVFTKTPFEGNPLAVFRDATQLDTSMMQRIARELNLSETTFLFPEESRGSAMRVRIFTPSAEIDFAGHPTIGTGYVMRRLGLVPSDAQTFTLIENVGPISVRVEASADGLFWLTAPETRDLGEVSREQCALAVSLGAEDLLGGVPCKILSAGNPMLFIPLKDTSAVDRASIDAVALAVALQHRAVTPCVYVFSPTMVGAYSRMFAPHLGVDEDPATGSAAGPLVVYMMMHGLAISADGSRYLIEQGRSMRRPSMLHVHVHGTGGKAGIEVGGNVTHIATGHLRVPSVTRAPSSR